MQHKSDPTPSIPVRADDETASAEYASRFLGPVGEWMLRVQGEILQQFVAPYIQPPPTRLKLLDVGGGHAQVANTLFNWLPAPAFEFAVAGSTPTSKRRLTAYVESGLCQFHHADLLHLPFPERSFDVVTCFRLLPHCDEWPELIQELCRVARRAVIVDYPTSQSLNLLTPLLFSAKKSVEKNTRPYTLFRKNQINGAFAKHGFCLRREAAQFFFPMALHRAVQRVGLSQKLERYAQLCRATALLGSPLISLYEPDQPNS